MVCVYKFFHIHFTSENDVDYLKEEINMRNSKLFSRILILALIAVVTLSMSILTPEVAAASEDPITETKKTETSTYNKEDDSKALARAIAMDEAKLEAESIVTELLVEAEQEEETQAQVVEAETVAAVESEQQTESSSTSSSTSSSESTSGSYVDPKPSSGGGYLMDISNPDPNYAPYPIVLSDADREAAERIVMGEAGHTGYNGMALVAQTLRDNYVRGGYSDIKSVINNHGYYGTQSLTPTQQCKDVVNYIFDQGGSAVQHRILVFYASNYCSSSWHESQNFIVQHGYVRFFDCWY